MENRSPNLACWDLYGHVCLFQIPGCAALQAQWPSRWAHTPWSVLPQDCCSYCPVHPDSPQDHHPVGILFLQSQLSYLEAFPDFWPHQIPLWITFLLASLSLHHLSESSFYIYLSYSLVHLPTVNSMRATLMSDLAPHCVPRVSPVLRTKETLING